MGDRYGRTSVSTNDPAIGGYAITKSDATVFDQPTRALWVGGDGDVAVRMLGGDTVTFVGVLAGTILPVRVDKVLNATTATSIVGMY